MKQGRLFMPEDPPPGRVPLTEGERIHAVALAMLSCPGAHRVWTMSAARRPDEIYRIISAGAEPRTQGYCTGVYPRNPLDAAEVIVRDTEKKSIRILTYWDHDYPALLREIQCPPLALYFKGMLPEGTAVAVVGTRKSDARSSSVARRIARELSARGCAVVSGMAVGIDREAHLGALEGGGLTVGVLANGIDIIYPWPNRDLYRLIEASRGSALVSEYPPGIFAGKWTFVRRNRIISGLCAGTVVVKAGERSGALITARHAVEQNREVFACAGGSFEEEYAGCHRLVRDGAVLVSCTEDILTELSRVPAAASFRPAGEPCVLYGSATGTGDAVPAEPRPDTLEGRIFLLLSSGERDIDSIVRELSAATGEVSEAVVSLELDGRIIRNGNTISRL